MATTLRFILLGDDKASASFNRFAKSVENANKSVDRSNASLSKQSASMSKLGLVMTGLSAATGILEPVMAGLVVTTGALAVAAASAGAGLGAFGLALLPQIEQAKTAMQAQAKATQAAGTAQITYGAAVTAANAQYQRAMAVATTATQRKAAAVARDNALAAAQAARTKTVTVANQAYAKQVAALPGPTRQFTAALTAAKDTYTKWSNSLAAPVLSPLTRALQLVRPVLKAISPLVIAAAQAIGTLVTELSVKIAQGGLVSVVTVLLPHVRETILNLAHSLGNVAAGIWGVLKAFAPMSDVITGGVVKLTARFKEWGASLPSHSGFQSLMSMFRSQTPLASGVLKNLAVIIANVARATTGLASPANSKALLQILTPLSQIMVRLTANQGLVRAVLYFLLFKKTLEQFKIPLKAARDGFDALSTGLSTAQKAYGVIGRFAGGFANANAAASAFSGTAGTMGGNLRTVITVIGDTTKAAAASSLAWLRNTAALVASKTVLAAVWAWQKLITAAQWLWNAAVTANPIGILIVALAALGVALYLAWTRSATFRKILIGAWTAVRDTAMTVVGWFTGSFVPFFTRTIPRVFQAVLNWVKVNWPWLIGALTGPIGLAIVWIVKNWGRIVSGLQQVLGSVVGWFRGLPGRILGALGKFGTLLYGVGASVINGLWNGLKAAWKNVMNWASGLWHDFLSHLGPFHSPPKWASWAGEQIVHGLFGWLSPAGKHKLITQASTIGKSVGSTVAGSAAQMYAAGMLPAYGWGKNQWASLQALWQRESGWQWNATNPSSGAYGIPQSLPASKMASAGADWRTNAATQIRWGLGYIKSVYGSPAAAWAHELAAGWYDRGGFLPRGWSLALNTTGSPEPVGAARGGGDTYILNVSVPESAHPAETGRRIARYLREYKRTGGKY